MQVNNYELYDDGRAKYIKHTPNINDEFIRVTIENNKIYSRRDISEGDIIAYGNNNYECYNVVRFTNSFDGDFTRCEAELRIV